MKPLSVLYLSLFRHRALIRSSNLHRLYSKECRLNVSQYGKITSTNSSGTFKISPLNPHQYLEQDVVILNSDDCNITEHVQQNESQITLTGHRGTCLAEIPMKFDLDLQTTGTESIHVDGFENEFIDLKTDKGTCALKKLMTRLVSVETNSGDVSSESSLQADVNIRTKTGNVHLYKVLGQSLTISAEHSTIHVNALYSLASEISVRSGDISINHCHHDNQVSIKEEGNVHVGTLDGSFVAKVGRGNVDIELNNPTKVNISVDSGDITLNLPENVAVDVGLSGSDIYVDESLQEFSALQLSPDGTTLSGVVRGSAEPPSPRIKPLVPVELAEVRVKTGKGTVRLLKKDWLASIVNKRK